MCENGIDRIEDIGRHSRKGHDIERSKWLKIIPVSRDPCSRRSKRNLLTFAAISMLGNSGKENFTCLTKGGSGII